MRRKSIKFLYVIMLLWVLVAISGTYIFHKNALEYARNLLAIRMIDCIDIIKQADRDMKMVLETYKDALLVICKSMALTLKYYPPEKSHELLKELVECYNLESYCVIDKQGIIKYSNESEVIGYDMSSNEQSREFIAGLYTPDFQLVQEPQCRGVDGKVCVYAGVPLCDGSGLLQIGYSDLTNYQNAYDIGEIQKRLRSVRIGQNGFIVVLKNREVIASENEKMIGRHFEVGYENVKHDDEFSYIELYGETYLACCDQLDDLELVALLPVNEIKAKSDVLKMLMLVSTLFMVVMLWVCIRKVQKNAK